MTPLRAALPLVAALVLAGCPFHPRNPVPGPLQGEWAAARGAATRRVQLYDGLVHRASATATHLGLVEREARARRLGEWFGWTAVELERRLAEERAEAAAGEEFLLAFYTPNAKTNDLDARESIWRIAIEADDGIMLASKVEAVDPDATLTALFPYVGIFDTVYRVRFAKPPGGPLAGRMYVLELSSALGRLYVDFGVADGAEKPLEEPRGK